MRAARPAYRVDIAEPIPFPAPDARRAPRIDPLWRHLVGEQLRRRRHERGETLADVAARAGVSVQYLSEVERGLKEPSRCSSCAMSALATPASMPVPR
ncbi:helix-turn-helix domain-containing protein [Microbacterium sp. NPDC003461]